MRNNSVNYFQGDAFKRYFLSGALVALLVSAVKLFVQFWQRIL